MKKLVFGFFAMVILSFNAAILSADCSDDKKIVEDIFITADPLYLNGQIDLYIDIYNLSDDIYLDFYNDKDKKSTIYSVEDIKAQREEGVFNIVVPNVSEDIKYSFSFYSNSCGNEKIKVIGDEIDKVNKYAYSDFCKGNHNKSELCDVFADTEGMNEEEVKKKVEQQVKAYEFKLKIKSSVKKYYLFVLIPVLLIIIVFGVKIYLLKKKQKQKLG